MRDEIVMVPVPREHLADVYAVLGRGARSGEAGWEPLALGALRGSVWAAREIVAPAARGLARQDPEQLGVRLAGIIRQSTRALFDPHEPGERDPDS